MSIIELGALGELLGAVGVIATLIYLAIQVGQNTRSLDESRKLSVAQAYQVRAEMGQNVLNSQAESPLAAAIYMKLEDDGLEALNAEERWRLTRYSIAEFLRFDNVHFQYERGFIDDEYYETVLKGRIRSRAPLFRELGIVGVDSGVGRPSFQRWIDDILSGSDGEAEENGS